MASSNSSHVAAVFSFMNLPLEIRPYFYRMTLPSQDLSMRSSNCAAIHGTPNEFMNLLLVNRQISDEARQVLYGGNSFTVAVSGDEARFPGLRSQPKLFRPFLAKPMPSLEYIRTGNFAWYSIHLGRKI